MTIRDRREIARTAWAIHRQIHLAKRYSPVAAEGMRMVLRDMVRAARRCWRHRGGARPPYPPLTPLSQSTPDNEMEAG